MFYAFLHKKVLDSTKRKQKVDTEGGVVLASVP